MPEYRRIKQEGGIYFFTLVTYKRQRLFDSSNVRTLLLTTIEDVKDYHPFEMIAYCVLPDHIHLIWQMPENDADYSMRIRLIKRRFSKRFIPLFGERVERSESQIKRREVPIWQRRFWEHLINDEDDLERHIEYIHFNPVKHGLVQQAANWDCSSFNEFVEKGIYDRNWGEGYKVEERNYSFGE